MSVPLVGPATPSSAPLQAVRTLRPKMLGVQALRMLQSPLAGHKGVRPSLEGHTFACLTFDESGEPLPEAGLSQILLDGQSLGVDLEELPSTHIRGHSSSVPWLTNDFVVGCEDGPPCRVSSYASSRKGGYASLCPVTQGQQGMHVSECQSESPCPYHLLGQQRYHRHLCKPSEP